MICPIHQVDLQTVFCGCSEDFLTTRALLEANYWRWRAESSEFAVQEIPPQWRFLAFLKEISA